MQPDLWALYRQMLMSRLFEIEVTRLWEKGLISGEMHLGIGEEAIMAGVVSQLIDGDAMALDHRGTAPLLMRGVDPVLLLREFLGRADGLCRGMGGHMHLFSPEHLAASSGIVGASGPAAVGFALAARHLRPGTLAVAFFGEGALNQGMLMEAMNLASAWKLPVLFICKDNDMAITTRSSSVTSGTPVDRAKGFAMHSSRVDGSDVSTVWKAACTAMHRARAGKGPTFLHMRCRHFEGHMLGDPLLRIARRPLKEIKQTGWPLIKSFSKGKGAPIRERTGSMRMITSLIKKSVMEQFSKKGDPVGYIRKALKSDETRLRELEVETNREVRQVVEKALAPDDTCGREE
ncbi:MAG: thiamine pyrophosphate-dependent dehydrogenase E1 component subunit alpha [bacterium]|nr:thiamine pyrophosphate-dependent dehydrogenase E1 component subunit alpha [bacterium]